MWYAEQRMRYEETHDLHEELLPNPISMASAKAQQLILSFHPLHDKLAWDRIEGRPTESDDKRDNRT